MYLCVAWQAFTEDTDVLREINHSVTLAFGELQRAQLLPRVVLLRTAKLQDINDVIADLDGVERTYPTMFGYTLFLHDDGDRYRCSDPFDVVSAQAVTRAKPI